MPTSHPQKIGSIIAAAVALITVVSTIFASFNDTNKMNTVQDAWIENSRD